jgi:hypothetical protein
MNLRPRMRHVMGGVGAETTYRSRVRQTAHRTSRTKGIQKSELGFRTYVPADLGETFASGLPSSSPVQFAGRENDV